MLETLLPIEAFAFQNLFLVRTSPVLAHPRVWVARLAETAVAVNARVHRDLISQPPREFIAQATIFVFLARL